MLKDITLGQYFPGHTLWHRLDPRIKILLLLLYIVALFAAKNIFAYLLVAVALCLVASVAKIGIKSLLHGMKPVIFIVLFTAVINLFFTPGLGTPVVSFGIFHIYAEGIRTAIFMVLRILLLISCTFILTYTTSPLSLTDALESLLHPLSKLRIPVHEFAMMMSIALRFIPTLIEETDKIMSAQRARGARFDAGNIINRAKALIPLLVPLFVSAFRRADELALAMECRCYHGGEGRTRLHLLHCSRYDYCILSAAVLLMVSVFLLNRVL